MLEQTFPAQRRSSTMPRRTAWPRSSPITGLVHLDALRALSAHPRLRLEDERFDRHWLAEMRADREAQERARIYFESPTDEERARRASPQYVEDYLPFDPKERYSSDPPRACPVCELETLVVEWLDSYAGEYGAGTCMSCGYTRTQFVADDLGMDAKLSRISGRE
jgi:hypothetical protein